ncbi:MAG: dihydrofolate reductase family protein [Mycobacteriales bacterium]
MRLLLPEPRPLAVEDLLELYAPGDAPSLRAGFVLTVDGGVAHRGTSRALQSPADEAAFHTLRAVADAVLVGAGTARSEDYGPIRPRPAGRGWRARNGRPPQPPLVLVSRSLDLDPTARCFDPSTVVVTCAAARGRDRFPDVVVAGEDEVDLPDALDQLRARGLTRLLCEGGPQLLTALLRAGLVDEFCLTHTPLLLGAGAPTLLTAPQLTNLELTHLVDGGGGVLLGRYAVLG